jgi:Undecaprenyl-phosphate glucose phosphotransferase
MNTQLTYTLAARPRHGGIARHWAWLSRPAFSAIVASSDIALIMAMSCLTGVTYHLAVYHFPGDIAAFLQVGGLAASIFAISNIFRGEYRLANFFTFKPHARNTIQLWNVTLICLLLLGYLAQISVDYSRGWIVLFYIATLAGLVALRAVMVRLTARARSAGLISAQQIFLIGSGTDVSGFLNRYEPWSLGYNIVGCRFLTPVGASAPQSVRREMIERDLAEAVASVRSLNPDAVFLLMPWSSTAVIERCADAFLKLPVEIHLGPEPILHKFEEVELSRLGSCASLQITRLPLSRFELLQKRLFDLTFASLGLIALTPLLIAVAVLIKLDSRGPVFFLQRRYGFNQQPFRIIKFRSMTTMEDGEAVREARPDDPRLTRVGRFLRRWNIDEIPQLFNVLTGEMSLVGPRPHALSHDRDYERRISIYARRHKVKPGITGWAQIHGYRGQTDTEEKLRKRVEYDLFYIDNWSMWLDLSIIMRTALTAAAYRNAY